MKFIFFDHLELETPIEFTNDVLPGCLDTNSETAYDDVLITGYGLTSKVLINPKTGEKYTGDISRFLKELEYKDVSNQHETCSTYKGIICVNTSNNEKERYCQNRRKIILYQTNFSYFF